MRALMQDGIHIINAPRGTLEQIVYTNGTVKVVRKINDFDFVLAEYSSEQKANKVIEELKRKILQFGDDALFCMPKDRNVIA